MAKKKTKGVSKFRAAVAANVKKQKSEGAKYGYFTLPSDLKLFKEEPGSRITLDIIPYVVTDPKHMDRDTEKDIATVGEQWYKKPYFVHRGVGANNESYVCPSTIGKKCPICEYRAKLLKEGRDYQDPDIKALRPSKRNLYVVVPLNSKEYDQKPHLWDISQFLFQDKLNEELNEDPDKSVFPDPDEGYSLRIRFSEEQFGKNKFASTSRIDFIERDHQYTEKEIKALPDIDAIIQIFPYNTLEAKYFEYDDEDGDEENFSSVRKSKKLEVEEGILELDDEDEDEEEETVDEELDDEEEAEEDEDESEEDEDDDEEEDEIPEEERCVACKGTGVSSKGTKCKPCDGTGRKKVEEDEEEEEEEKPAPKKKTKAEPKKKTKEKAPAKTKKSAKNKCPHGYRFGADCEQYDECDECEVWDACIDAKDEEE